MVDSMQLPYFVGLMRIVLNLWKGTQETVQERPIWCLYKSWRHREIKIGQMRLQKWIKEQYYDTIASKEKLAPLLEKSWHEDLVMEKIPSHPAESWVRSVWIVGLLLHQWKDPGRCREASYAKEKWDVTPKMAVCWQVESVGCLHTWRA